MNNYKKAVEELAKNSEYMEFDNKGSEHASIVLENMLKYADTNFKIYTGNFNGDVANDDSFLKYFNRFIENKKEVKVIIESLPSDVLKYSKALKRIIDLNNNPAYNVKYKLATTTFKKDLENIFQSKKPYHFSISDSKAYRVEIEPNTYKAIVNFNDPQITKKLELIFDNFFQN